MQCDGCLETVEFHGYWVAREVQFREVRNMAYTSQ